MRMQTHQRMATIFWLIVGAYVAIHSYRLGLGSFRAAGPGLVFFLAALLFIALAAIDLIMSVTGKPDQDRAVEERPLWKGLRWQKVLLVLVGLSAYVCLFNFTGFILSTFLLMVFLFKAVEPAKWWTAVVSGLITTGFSYFIFEVWLEVPFPKGVLGF